MRALPPAARIIELGPGIGHIARLAGRDDLRWLGLEGAVDCVGELRRVLAAGAIVDLESLDRLPTGSSVVLAADTLEHLSDPQRMLRAIHHALPPAGLLLLSVPNVANVYVRLNLLFGRFPYADRGILDRTHRYFFTSGTLLAMVRDSGFAVEKRTVSLIPLPLALPRLPRPVTRLLTVVLAVVTRALPGLFGYQLILAARRL